MISCICSLFLFFSFPFDDVVGALLFIDRRKSFTRKQKLGTSKDPIKNTTEKPKTVHNFRKKPSSHGSAINLGLFWITALPIFWHWPCSALTICMEANNWRAKTCITLPLLVFSPAAGRTQGSRILRQKKKWWTSEFSYPNEACVISRAPMLTKKYSSHAMLKMAFAWTEFVWKVHLFCFFQRFQQTRKHIWRLN